MKRISFVALAGLLVLGACKNMSDIPHSVSLGIVTVATGDAVSGIHTTSPTAYFVDAVNVSIPNSGSNADTCAQLDYPGITATAPLSQIDAGTPVLVATTLDTAQLAPTPADANGYIFYRLPAGDSIRVAPGTTARVTVPGATNGFHPFSLSFVTADSLHVQPIDATSDSTGELPITWNPQNGVRSSFVIQLEFSTTPTGLPNSQIFCQFTDNGSHSVQASLANLWRSGSAKHVHAYRFLTTPNSDGSNEMVAIAQYSTDSTHIINP